jgi:hypothetical protein
LTIRALLRGIIKSTPRIPPSRAKEPILKRLGLKPHIKRAGMVKISPEAREELAEPVVWAMLQSRIELFPRRGRNALKTATEITARGIAVEIVSPTLKPR